MSVKASRQRALEALLRSRQVSSQARLLDLLRVQGFDATQATVSRDLEELGATKVRAGDGQLVYALPDADPSPEVSRDQLSQVLSMFMLSAVPSGNLVVLRTPPGHAQALASAMDRAGLPDVAGTVAGDDTVLVVCADRTSGRAMARQLRELITPAPAGARDGSRDRQATSTGTALGPAGLQPISRGEPA
jgi:transcriptional regulator of arginine metabolism